MCIRDSVRAGASKKLGAFRLKLRLKPPLSVDRPSLAERPQAPCLSQVPRGGEVTFPCPTRMPVRLVTLPLLQTLPSTDPIVVPFDGSILWHSSPSKVMAIKAGI